jgi:membrane protease YdiL (CAAX protease family)
VLIVAIMVAGPLGVVVAWRLVVSDRASIWPVLSVVAGASGLAALATGKVPLSARVRWPVAAAAGAGAGAGFYLATAAFVLIVRRWPAFDRHVAELYDQRRGLGLWPALALASGASAPGEELFWRGLFEWRLARAVGWPGAAVATWGAYVLVNLASQNLPIIAGAVVGGAVWGGLALWTRGVVASLACHVVWTGLMLARPPGGPGRRGRAALGSLRPEKAGPERRPT